jgi:hypothetical protein
MDGNMPINCSLLGRQHSTPHLIPKKLRPSLSSTESESESVVTTIMSLGSEVTVKMCLVITCLLKIFSKTTVSGSHCPYPTKFPVYKVGYFIQFYAALSLSIIEQASGDLNIDHCSTSPDSNSKCNQDKQTSSHAPTICSHCD